MVTMQRTPSHGHGGVAFADEALRKPPESQRKLGLPNHNHMAQRGLKLKCRPESQYCMSTNDYKISSSRPARIVCFFPKHLLPLKSCLRKSDHNRLILISRRKSNHHRHFYEYQDFIHTRAAYHNHPSLSSSNHLSSCFARHQDFLVEPQNKPLPQNNSDSQVQDCPNSAYQPDKQSSVKMSSTTRTYISDKYDDREDLLAEYSHGFIGMFQANPEYHATLTDKQLDQEIKTALKYIHGIRDEMVLLKLNGPICEEELADLVHEARGVYRSMKFRVRRHYQNKEEGLRLRRQIAYLELEQKQHTSHIAGLLAHSLYMLKTRTALSAAALNRQCENKLMVLDKAMAKIDSDRLLVLSAAEGLCSC